MQTAVDSVEEAPWRALLMLSLPNVLLVAVQTSMFLFEAFYVAQVGTPYLAALALVTPFYMLMFMLASGGISSAVSSSVARLLGANDVDGARRAAAQGLSLAVVAGLAFLAIALLLIPFVFRSLWESRNAAITGAAIDYGAILFAGAPAVFVYNALAGALRGAGSMRAPAAISIAASVATIVLSPLVMFGVRGGGGLGFIGAACVTTLVSYVATAVLALRVFLTRHPVRPAAGWVWSGALLRPLLAVAVPSAILAMVNMLVFAFMTGVFSRLGTDGAAAYAAISRVEYMILLICYALGIAAIREVGRRLGAGDMPGARRAAWRSAALGAIAAGIPGLLLFLFPTQWLAVFLDDASAIRVGAVYLRLAAWSYAAFGLGLGWLFAAQALGELKPAFLVTLLRAAGVIAIALVLARLGMPPGVAAAAASVCGFLGYAAAMALHYDARFATVPAGGVSGVAQAGASIRR
jgi:putative MATE family efflux protein